MESDISIINCIHIIKKTNWRFLKWEKWTVGSCYL